MDLNCFFDIAAKVIVIIAFVLAVYRLILLRKTFFSDHASRRGVKAIDLIQFWTSNLGKKPSLARKIVESLDEKQCISLVKQEQFVIDSNKKRFVN